MPSNVDYKATYFEFKALTKTHGKPTNETLRTLHDELKANAGTVPSSLGGGANGHLGLVIDQQQYTLISNIPYNRPQQPPPFILPPNTTPEIAMILRDSHNENTRVYREFLGVENALRQQIVESVEHRWLRPLRSTVTNSITMPVYDIITYLFRIHGKISPAELQQRVTTVTSMVYEPIQPIDDVFDAVQDIADLAQVAGAPYTIQQLVNMAYVIINNTRKFGQYITDWNRLPPQQRSWINFKDFFRIAHSELQETTDLTAQDTPYQANLIREIVQGLKDEFQEMAVPSSYANNMADVSENNDEISTLQDEIQSLKSTVSQLKNQMISHVDTNRYSVPPTYINSSQPGIYNTIASQTAPSPTDATFVTDTSSITGTRRSASSSAPTKREWFYCWTHGVCGHTGNKCFRKAQGHVDKATFENIHKGSVKGLKRYNRTNNK